MREFLLKLSFPYTPPKKHQPAFVPLTATDSSIVSATRSTTLGGFPGCLGLRASEVMGLKWGDVNWHDLAIFVRRSVVAGREGATKTEASQKPLPLDSDLAKALLHWRDQAYYVSDSDFVFTGDSGKPRWQGMVLKDYIQPAATQAGIGKVGWHTFRHSYRAWLKRSNAPIEVQKELMRHSNLKTTVEIYSIEPDVAPEHRSANSGVVKLLLGKS